jgi:hypothetical protein
MIQPMGESIIMWRVRGSPCLPIAEKVLGSNGVGLGVGLLPHPHSHSCHGARGLP